MRSRSPAVREFIRALALPAVIVLGVAQLGCDSPQEMRSARSVPASQGTVSATAADNGNTSLSIQVRHLAPPSQVASGAMVYVVWVQAPDADAQNVGALTLNDELEGSLDTVTPQSRFRLTVTPEASGTVDRPTNAPVFTATVDRS